VLVFSAGGDDVVVVVAVGLGVEIVVTDEGPVVNVLELFAGNTKGGSTTVPLTSCLIGLESAV